MNVMSDLSVFFPPSLAWEFYNSLRRKSVASFKDSQVRNSTPLPPSPPCLLCRPTLHCSLACRLQHECCMLLQPSPTPFPCNHFGALLFFGVCVCVCARFPCMISLGQPDSDLNPFVFATSFFLPPIIPLCFPLWDSVFLCFSSRDSSVLRLLGSKLSVCVALITVI